MLTNNPHLEYQLLDKGNGEYKFDYAAIRAGVIAATILLLTFGALFILAGIQKRFSPALSAFLFLLMLGGASVIRLFMKLSGRILQISPDRITIRDKRGGEIGSLGWIELAKVTERRAMAQLALWDKSGTRRVLVDQHYENFEMIRSRILAEYAKAFTLPPLPMEFSTSNSLLVENFILAAAVALFGWTSWASFRQGRIGMGVFLLCFLILTLLSLLKLHPQIVGPSVLYEDRVVLQSFFKREVLHKKDIATVELKDAVNPQSRTKYSFLMLDAISGKQLKITAQYGNIPEIYVALRAWLNPQ